jgi:hypothetical protein
MGNNGFGVSTDTTMQTYPTTTNSFIGKLDAVRVLFEYIFTSPHSMKQKNKYVFLFLDHHIKINNVKLLNRYLSDNALRDCHPSILKSTLIMTENVPGIEESRAKVVHLFNEKMTAY